MTKLVALKKQKLEPFLCYATVEEEFSEGFSINYNGYSYFAKTAVSCLVKPEIGDRVIASIQEGACYIIAVLERTINNQDTVISTRGNLHLHAEGGSVTVTATERVNLAMQKLTIASKEGELSFGNLSIIGNSVNTHAHQIRTAALEIETLANALNEKINNYLRLVRQKEVIQSHSTTRTVEEAYTLQTKKTLHTAEDEIIMNASQIHLS